MGFDADARPDSPARPRAAADRRCRQPVEADEEERELAARLMAELSPEAIAVALVQVAPHRLARAGGYARPVRAARTGRNAMQGRGPASRIRPGSGSMSAAGTMPIRAGCCR